MQHGQDIISQVWRCRQCRRECGRVFSSLSANFAAQGKIFLCSLPDGKTVIFLMEQG